MDNKLIDEIDRDEIRRAISKARRCGEISCPHDSQVLMELSHEGIKIDVCPCCYGIWLDEGELEKIKNEFHEQKAAKAIAGHLLVDPILMDLVPVIIRSIGKALSSLSI